MCGVPCTKHQVFASAPVPVAKAWKEVDISLIEGAYNFVTFENAESAINNFFNPKMIQIYKEMFNMESDDEPNFPIQGADRIKDVLMAVIGELPVRKPVLQHQLTVLKNKKVKNCPILKKSVYTTRCAYGPQGTSISSTLMDWRARGERGSLLFV